MINNLAVNQSTGDLLEASGQISQVTSVDAIAQGIASDLQTFFGEYWLDKKIGVPYYSVVFKKGTDLSLIKTLLKNEIQKRDDVIEVTKFSFVYLNEERKATIVFSAKVILGQIEDQEISL